MDAFLGRSAARFAPSITAINIQFPMDFASPKWAPTQRRSTNEPYRAFM
jgi:hypothetical protein